MAMSMFRLRRFWTDRAGATAVVFAVAVPAMMLMVAVAIDFGGAVAAKTQLDLAADAAAMTAATTASQMYIGGSTSAQIQAAAPAAGQNRFAAAFSSINNVSTPTVPLPTITQSTSAFTASLTAAATYTPYFAQLLGVGSVPLSTSSTVTVALTAPYLNVEILLDNSGSMEIGATPSDIATMQELTACGLTGAYYCTASTGSGANQTCSTWVQSGPVPSNSRDPYLPASDPYYTSSSSGQDYSHYVCGYGGYSYSGSPSCPLLATTLNNINYPNFPATGSMPGPSCPSVVPMPAGTRLSDTTNPSSSYYHSGFPPAAGAPCAFACHFDTSSAAGTGNDYYALARSTIGTSYQVTLRFDLVKSAVNQVISTMQADNLPSNNLNVGIFWFADVLTKVYPDTDPTSTAVGNAWATAVADVGGPATTANGADTGIPPYVGVNAGNTDFATIMGDLQGTRTAAGTGATSTSPRKVLFIVTDGLQDSGNKSTRTISGFDPSYCTALQNMGYGIYVLYTPYYPLMNDFYLQNVAPVTNSIASNLQQCASSPDNYIEASDSASIAAALQTFLKQALISNAKITK